MNWQDSLRGILLATLALQLMSTFVFYDLVAVNLELRDFCTKAKRHDEIPESVQRLDNSDFFLLTLYKRQSEWFGILNHIEQRLLRQKLVRLFGMDGQVLESGTAGSQEEFEPILKEQYHRFQKGWRDEILRSTQAAKKYLKEPRRELLLSVITGHDQRFQDLPYVLDVLQTVVADIQSSKTSAPELEKVSERDTQEKSVSELFESDIQKKRVSEIAKILESIQDLYRILNYVHEVRICVDQDAYVRGWLDKVGTLAYGPNNVLGAAVPRVESVAIFGMTLRMSERDILMLLFCNILFLGVLLRLVWVSREETFGKNLPMGSSWFLLAFPVYIRYVVLVVIPLFGMIVELALVTLYFTNLQV